jgi:hypothetical protein
MSPNIDRDARLAEVARIAVALEAHTGLPAPMLIAQWAVESQWGAKPVGHANYFGVKKNNRDKGCCTEETREVINGKSVIEDLEFADYSSLEDSCRDYAWLITQGEAVPCRVAEISDRPQSSRFDRCGRHHLCNRSEIHRHGDGHRRPVECGACHCRRPPERSAQCKRLRPPLRVCCWRFSLP